MIEVDQYTVFVTAPSGWSGYSNVAAIHDLDEAIAHSVRATDWSGGDFTPVAWMRGSCFGSYDRSRAASLAAGRVIELVDGKYVARGVGAPGNSLEDKNEPESPMFVGHFDFPESVVGVFGGLCSNGKPLPESVTVCGDTFSATERPPKTTVKRVARPSHSEPKRAPLPGYGKTTPFDPFKGFTVKSDSGWMVEDTPFLCASPDLQDESLSRHQLATVKG